MRYRSTEIEPFADLFGGHHQAICLIKIEIGHGISPARSVCSIPQLTFRTCTGCIEPRFLMSNDDECVARPGTDR